MQYLFQVYSIVVQIYEMITMISLGTIYHHKSYYSIDYILYRVNCIPMIYFMSGSLYLLIPFTYYVNLPTSAIWQ